MRHPLLSAAIVAALQLLGNGVRADLPHRSRPHRHRRLPRHCAAVGSQ